MSFSAAVFRHRLPPASGLGRVGVGQLSHCVGMIWGGDARNPAGPGGNFGLN